MGSYGIIIKTEEIRRRVQEGDYDSAQKIIDTMVLKKVKNIADLSLFAEVFIRNKRYDEAMELLYRVYKKSKTRRTLYQMLIASIGRKNIEEAEGFLSEYKKVAPNDFGYYKFRYKIDKLKKEPYDVLIDSLRKLKQHSYMEKWAYELAKLYYKAGMEKECIQECSDIILWFGEGSYVEKAKILKAYYSGEVDKDEIIEKLKNRAYKDKSLLKQDDKSVEKSSLDDQDMIIESETDSQSQEIREELEEDMQTEHIDLPDKEAEDKLINEITDNMRKEADSLLTIDHKKDTDKELTQDHVENEINSLLKLNVLNEDLERLDRLSESLNVNVRQIFGNFLHIKELQKQLVKSLELIMNKRTKSVQMIITGAPSSGKTTLAKEIAIFLNKTGKLKTSRIAKISALKLNDIDITKKTEELRNCCLVIENAGELKRPAIDRLLELIKILRGDIAVIFEENKKNLNRLFRECPKLMELFKNRIHIPSYSEDDLLGFAYANIVFRGYKLQPSALEALKNGVYEIINNEEKEKRLEKISKYIQNAMTSADIRTGKQLPKLTAEGKLADIEVLSLLSEDFTKQIIV